MSSFVSPPVCCIHFRHLLDSDALLWPDPSAPYYVKCMFMKDREGLKVTMIPLKYCPACGKPRSVVFDEPASVEL